MNVTIVDKNGNIISPLEYFINGVIADFDMEDNWLYVDYVGKYQNIYVKPKWNGETWIESATEAELQEWKEKNQVVETQKSELEILKETVDTLVLASLGV